MMGGGGGCSFDTIKKEDEKTKKQKYLPSHKKSTILPLGNHLRNILYHHGKKGGNYNATMVKKGKLALFMPVFVVSLVCAE